ncbi:hypothetical protein IWQ62_001399 [Dispira parvispora]|uniref:DUF1746 domain-containing protein n=1 Tax=Dispira parvispora TaxID=1520584 RepID=A0A9W8ASH3_9FUNG|nr:hypothetical protein IWQ62_001399 [Dispira parvispora]
MASKKDIAVHRLLRTAELALKVLFVLLYLFDRSFFYYLLRVIVNKFVVLRSASTSLQQSCLVIAVFNVVSVLRHITMSPSQGIFIDFVGQSWSHKIVTLFLADTTVIFLQMLLVLTTFHAFSPAARDGQTLSSSEASDQGSSDQLTSDGRTLNRARLSMLLSQLSQHLDHGTVRSEESESAPATMSRDARIAHAAGEPTQTSSPSTLSPPPIHRPTLGDAQEETSLLVTTGDYPGEDDLYVLQLSWSRIKELFSRSHQAFNSPPSNASRESSPLPV